MRISNWFGVVAALALLVAARAWAASDIEAQRAIEASHLAESDALAKTGHNNLIWAEVEVKWLAWAQGHVERHGADLELKLLNGKTRRFKTVNHCDLESAESECNIFSLVAYLPSRHLFVVNQSLYEGLNFFLIDERSGAEAKLSEQPVFGADPVRLVVFADGDGDAPDGPEIEIWHLGPGAPVKEWSWVPKDGRFPEFKLKSWSEPGEIRVECHYTGPSPAESSIGEILITRDGNRWKVIEHP